MGGDGVRVLVVELGEYNKEAPSMDQSCLMSLPLFKSRLGEYMDSMKLDTRS